MPPPTKYKSPYEDIDLGVPIPRITFSTSLENRMAIKCMFPREGSMQHIFELFHNKLVHELKRLQFNDFTSADVFQLLIGELFDPTSPEFGDCLNRVLFRLGQSIPTGHPVAGSATGPADGQTPHGNEHRGTEPVRDKNPRQPHFPPNIESDARLGGGTGGSGGSAKAGNKSKVSKTSRSKG